MCAKQYQRKICQYCGKEYWHWNGKSKYCSGPHYAVCQVCGTKFEFDISKGKVPCCCSKQCSSKKRRNTCVRKYGTKVPSQNAQVRKKLSESGHKAQSKMRSTCLQRYGVPFASQSQEVRQKMSNTLRSNKSRDKFKDTCMKKYGVEHPMQSKEVFDKHAKASKKAIACDGTKLDSEWEAVLYDFLVRNNIEFTRQVPLCYQDSKGNSHVTYIDFCIEGILFEVKGGHFLQGVFDYSGVPINDKLDVYRKNHVVVVTDNGHAKLFGKPNSLESNGLKYLSKCKYPLIGVDIDLFTKEAAFPYRSDRPEAFYDVQVSGHISSKQAFFDESIRWNMIMNRIMYSGGFIDANQVLTAMNVTRLCKQPSWFSKSFAKHVINNFITSDVVVDPFAGWGARYDACMELGKLYVGCDINEDLVAWHRSKGRDIQLNDAKKFTYDKPCSVFICPPYQDVEVYVSNQDCNLTQCQWLQIVMNNVPNANEYVMVCKVVDKGWEQYVVDKKVNKSHFGVNTEYVLCIPGKSSKEFTLSNEDIEQLEQQAKLYQSAQRSKRLAAHSKEPKVWMTNIDTNETKLVAVGLVADMQNLHWQKGRGNKINMSEYVWMHNLTQSKRVRKEQVDSYVQNGWVRGRLGNSTAGITYVHKDGVCKGAHSDELDEYIANGWQLGNGTSKVGLNKGNACGPKGKVCINNGSVNKFVDKEQVDTFLHDGWRVGRFTQCTNIYWMHNDALRKNIRISKDKISEYESQGWKQGQMRYRQ